MDAAVLRDLFSHLAWACAEHLHHVRAHPVAAEDEALRESMSRLALAGDYLQALFEGREPRLEPVKGWIALEDRAWSFHRAAGPFLEKLGPRQLRRPFPLPERLAGSGRILTLGEVLLQEALEAECHRARMQVHLHRLGVPSPATDYLAWCAQGRPAARWERT